MFNEFILFIKYPYTAGTIGIMWLGTAAFLAMDKDLPLVGIVIINMIASLIVVAVGFRGKGEL